MKPTQEQQDAVDAFDSGDTIKLEAFAGGAKTTTLEMMARSVDSPGVYLCFNKSIAIASQTRFPDTVACKTTHSYAYRAMAPFYKGDKDKMMGAMRAKDTADRLKIKALPIFAGTDSIDASTLGYAVNQTIRRFCQSADESFSNEHFFIAPKWKMLPTDEFRAIRTRVVGWAQQYWEMMVDPKTSIPLGHDGYVKAWQLSNPVINAVYILLDEAQDTNPVMLDVLKRQDAQIVYVGDKYQQIYEWRGAINAMEVAVAKRTLRLTKSFRYGQAIADFASEILATIGETVRITGNENIKASLTGDPQRVVLCRTNAEVLNTILEMDNLQKGKSFSVVGGVDDLSNCMEGVSRLQAGRVSAYPAFLGFNDWQDFLVYAEKSGDNEAGKIVRLVDQYGVNTLRNVLRNVYPSEEKADFLISTAHKAKGREWPGVQLANDFEEQPFFNKETEETEFNPSESRLFYVAATRAMTSLKVPAWAQRLYGGKGECSARAIEVSPSPGHEEELAVMDSFTYGNMPKEEPSVLEAEEKKDAFILQEVKKIVGLEKPTAQEAMRAAIAALGTRTGGTK